MRRLRVLIVGIRLTIQQIAFLLKDFHLRLLAADAYCYFHRRKHSAANLGDDDVRDKLTFVVATRIAAKGELIGKIARLHGVNQKAVLRGKDVGKGQRVVEMRFCRRTHEVEMDGEVASTAQHHIRSCTLRQDEGCYTLFASGLLHVSSIELIIAGRRTYQTTRANQAVQHRTEELCLAIEVLVRTFAEVDDTRLSHLVGITEDVVEAKQVGHCTIELPKRVGNEFLVVGDCVGHKTDVGFGSHADIRRVETTARCRAGCVGTMELQTAIRRASLLQDAFPARVGSTNGKPFYFTCPGFLSFKIEHIPERADAIVAKVAGVERRVGQVEANVHHSHHNALARVGRAMWSRTSQHVGMGDDGSGVGLSIARSAAFDARHFPTRREGGKLSLGDADCMDVSPMGIAAAIVPAKCFLAVGLHEDEHSRRTLLLGFCPTALTVCTHVLQDSKAHHGRHLAEAWALSHGEKRQKQGEKQHGRPACREEKATEPASKRAWLTLNGRTVRGEDGDAFLRFAPLVGEKKHDARVAEVAMYEHRQLLELVLVRDESRTGSDGYEHTAQVKLVLEVEELRPAVHFCVMRTHMTVLLLHISFYIRQGICMGMIFQMAIKLFPDAANVLEPLVEAHFVFSFLRYDDGDTADGAWRNDAPHGHHLAVRSVHHVVDDCAKRRLRHPRRPVVEADDDFAAVIFAHGVEDAACYVCAHTVEHCHWNVGGGGYHLRLLEQQTSATVAVDAVLVVAIVGDGESHQAVGDERIADEYGKLRHHIDVILLAVGDEAFAVIGTTVVLERRIAQGEPLGASVCGKTTDEAAEEDEHDCGSKHLGIDEMDLGGRADGDDGESSRGMGIGQAEHEPHAVPALSYPPRRDG